MMLIRGIIRTFKCHIEKGSTQEELREDSPVLPWLVCGTRRQHLQKWKQGHHQQYQWGSVARSPTSWDKHQTLHCRENAFQQKLKRAALLWPSPEGVDGYREQTMKTRALNKFIWATSWKCQSRGMCSNGQEHQTFQGEPH